VAAEPLQQRHNKLLEDGSTTRNVVQAEFDKSANASQGMMQQTPQDEVIQSDNVLYEELV
jgi:hypothetical protein